MKITESINKNTVLFALSLVVGIIFCVGGALAQGDFHNYLASLPQKGKANIQQPQYMILMTAAEEAQKAKQEAQRKKQEEAEKLEAEKKAKALEEARKLEAEKKAKAAEQGQEA